MPLSFHPGHPTTRILLSLAVVMMFALLSPAQVSAKGCNEGSPAVPVPSSLWGELRPTKIVQDYTTYTGSQLANANFAMVSSVDIENGYLFTSFWGGFKIWDARGANAANPVQLSVVDGWKKPSPFVEWVPGFSEIDSFIYSIDAPEGDDSIVGVGGISPAGVSIWDTRDKSGAKLHYQDSSREVQQVYAANIGGRSYLFAAAFGSGALIYDMTAARGFNSCSENTLAGGRNCSGVFLGKLGSNAAQYVHGFRFGNRHFVVLSSGVVATRYVDVWDVTNPASPTLVTSTIKPGVTDRTFYAGVALWEHQGAAYLAIRFLDDIKIYNMTTCLTSGCGGSLPAPLRTFPAARIGDSNYWKSLTFSRSGSTPFLFVGHHDLCHNGESGSHGEYLLDVSNPAQPRDVTPAGTIVDQGKTVDYWTWYHSDFDRGFSFNSPRGGKFNGPYFYRAAITIFDIHEWTGGGNNPPDANFTWSPSQIYPGDPVTFTDTSTGAVTSRSWTFPDGSPSASSLSAQSVQFSSPGAKQVRLDVSNTAGPSNRVQSVTVIDPSPAVSSVGANIATALICQPVTFTAEATGKAPLAFSWRILDPNNNPVQPISGNTSANPFIWGTQTVPPGQYKAEVTVSGQGTPAVGFSSLITLQPLPALPTSFAPTNDSFPAGTVQFHVVAAGATEWNWDFGDGQSTGWVSDPLTGPNPKHTYATTGQKTVTVKVRNCTTDPAGLTSQPLQVNIQQISPLLINEFQALCNFAPCAFPRNEAITFNQSFEGSPDTYEYDWDGNGTFEQSGPNPVTTHTYAQDGSYTPRMRIKRGAEMVERTHSFPLIVSGNSNPPPPPPPGPSLSISGPNSGQVDQAVSFTASANNCTPSSSWNWNPGGGTLSGSGNSVSITWSSNGSKTVSVTNSGCSGATGTKSVTISAAGGGGTGGGGSQGTGGLTANFSFSPSAPQSGQAVSFDAGSSQGAPTTYAWTFGDGQQTTGNSATTSHTYQASGTYTVKLEIGKLSGSCDFGFCSATITKQVTVGGTPPPAPLSAEFSVTEALCVSEFGVENCAAETGKTVTFTAGAGDATAYTWTFGDDGSTKSGRTVTHSFLQPGSFSVTLNVTKGQQTASKLKSFLVSGNAVVGKRAVVLPWIAQTRGALDQSSDLYVHNPGTTSMEVTLEFRKRGLPETTPPQVKRTIPPGATLYVGDVLDELFERENIAGFIAVKVDKGDVEPVITSFNTTFQADGKQFGQTVGGVSMSRLGAATSATAEKRVQSLVGLINNDERLTYFGLSNPSEESSTYHLSFYDKDGKLVSESSQDLTLSRFSQRQYQARELTDLFGISNLEDYRVEIETKSGGTVIPYASNLRLASEDPSFIESGAAKSSKVYLLGVLSAPGLNNSTWQSDILLSNTSAQQIQADVTFTSLGLNSEPTTPLRVTLPPGKTERLENVVASQWNINNGIGVLTITSTAPAGIFPVVQGESYENTNPAKRFGQAMTAFSETDAAGAGRGQYLVGLRQDASSHRTTLWLFNPGTTRGLYDVIYRALDGTIIGTTPNVALGAGKMRQLSPGQHPLPATGAKDGFTIQVVVKEGKVLSAAQVINNATNDPAYIKGEVR